MQTRLPRSLRRVRSAGFAAAALASAACALPRTGALVPEPGTRAELRHALDSMLTDAKFRGAQWGVLVVDPERGDTLYTHNAGKLFVPASNQKLITGAVALATLGASYRFPTTVSARGTLVEGTLRGDLVVTGSGDPSVSDRMRGDAMRPLREIADSLAARGITGIEGRLISGRPAFTGPTLGASWEWDDLDFPYAAGVDALFFNEGFTRVVVRGGASAGSLVTASTSPAASYPVVRVLATTADTTSQPRVVHDSTAPGHLVVTGTVALGRIDTITIAFRDQVSAYLHALLEALRERSIVVTAGVAAPGSVLLVASAEGSGQAMEPPEQPLFSVLSPPLAEILVSFEKPSQNQIGEILLRTVARVRTGVGSADSGRRVVRDQLIAWGARPDGFAISDGSGMSRHNVVTPETLALVLATMRNDSVFTQALPVAGVDGTLRSRMKRSSVEGKVRAKTGSLDMVRSLSGYATTADGRRLVFVTLANHWTVPAREVDAVQDAIAIRLTQLREARER